MCPQSGVSGRRKEKETRTWEFSGIADPTKASCAFGGDVTFLKTKAWWSVKMGCPKYSPCGSQVLSLGETGHPGRRLWTSRWSNSQRTESSERTLKGFARQVLAPTGCCNPICTGGPHCPVPTASLAVPALSPGGRAPPYAPCVILISRTLALLPFRWRKYGICLNPVGTDSSSNLNLHSGHPLPTMGGVPHFCKLWKTALWQHTYHPKKHRPYEIFQVDICIEKLRLISLLETQQTGSTLREYFFCQHSPPGEHAQTGVGHSPPPAPRDPGLCAPCTPDVASVLFPSDAPLPKPRHRKTDSHLVRLLCELSPKRRSCR